MIIIKGLIALALRIAYNFKMAVMSGSRTANILGAEDLDYYIQKAMVELVGEYFEDTMVDLRVKYTLPYQLLGLATALTGYIDISEEDVAGELSSSESMDNQVEDIIYNIVEDFLANIDDTASVCKNFWNGKDLNI